MLYETGTVTVSGGALSTVVGTGVDWSSVLPGSWIIIDTGSGYVTRLVTDVPENDELEVNEDFAGALTTRPYIIAMNLAGGNLTAEALVRFEAAREALTKLLAGTRGQVAAEISGNPNNLRVTIVGATSYVDGQLVAFRVQNTNSGAVNLEINELGQKDYKKAVGSEFGASEILPTEWTMALFNASDDCFYAVGRGGPAGATGSAGLAGGFSPRFTFSTTTTDSDPGSGVVRFNNATQGSATQLFVDLNDTNAVDVTALLDALDDSTSTTKGYLTVHQTNDPTKWITFELTSVTTATGYRKLVVTFKAQSGANPFANSAGITLSFTPKGDAGNPGGGYALEYDFSTTTSGDPGAGGLRLNNATPMSATSILVDNVDAIGNTVTAILDTLDDSTSTTNKGVVRLYRKSAPGAAYLRATLSSVTDSTGYRTIAITPVAAVSTFTNGERIVLDFSPKGDAGSATLGPGDVGTTELADNAVTNAKAADMATDTIKARVSTSTGDPEDVPLSRLFSFNPLVLNGTLTAVAGSNAIVVSLKTLAGTDPSTTNPVYILFPNATGGYTMTKVTVAVTLTVASGSTLGVPASTAFNIWVVLLIDSGTVYLGVVNCVDDSNGIFPLGAYGFTATSQQSGSNADTNHVVWASPAALAATTPYVTLGFFSYGTSGLGTPGTWGSSPASITLLGPGGKLPGEVIQSKQDFATAALINNNTSYTAGTSTSLLQAVLTLKNPANLVRAKMAGPLYMTVSGFTVYARMHRNGTVVGPALSTFASNSSLAVASGFTEVVDRPNIATAITYEGRSKSGSGSGGFSFPESSDGGNTGMISAEEIQG